jgi:exo-1,4-beta-D-glucosaminidase
MKKRHFLKTLIILVAASCFISCSKSGTEVNHKVVLKDGWKVQTSEKLGGLPGSILSGSMVTSDWYPAQVPSTIMGVLTSNGLFEDLFVGDSLKKIDPQQFSGSWWYRKEFSLPHLMDEQHVELCFDGISYYANIWLNGTLIAGRDKAFGTFRRFEFDVTDIIRDSSNVLAVEVFKQKPGDLGLGFVDWNPVPPDNNMGLWREVYLKVTGYVAIRNVFVQSDVNTKTLDEASLTITADIINYDSRSVSGKLNGKCEGIEFSVPVHLKACETKKVILTPREIKELHISYPRLWWCNNMGEPNLYNLNLQYVTNKRVSDAVDITFGIREVEAYFNKEGHKGFKLNGKEVLIKGAGWTDDIFLRNTPENNEIQVQYVKHMNLNTIRFENVWGTSQNIYDLCDKYGILAMVGWSCQWEWENYLGKPCDEHGGIKSAKDMNLAVEYLGDQIRYLQNHPSIFVWMVGSDMIPRPALEKRYRDLIASIDNRPYLAAASKRKSTISGPTGVKMNGPYNYVGPSYWYVDSVNGGAFGFNTETGPGPQPPVLETLKKMLPEKSIWPINTLWNYHCNPSESFGDLSIFNKVLASRYGSSYSVEDYLMKANVQSYEAMRAMFEAFRANRPNSTGIIQWMLNSAWPSFYWQLYDYYLLPTPAYYAVKKANEPLQLVFNYGNNRIYAVNETLKSYENAKAGIKLYDLMGNLISSDEMVLDLNENKSVAIYKVPPYYNTVFLSLTLLDKSNRELASNFYWLPVKNDVYDWEKTEWYYTPIKSSADFRAFMNLASAEVLVSIDSAKIENEKSIAVKLTNNSRRIAFFLNLTLRDEKGNTVYPVFWEDNYLSLLPGETRSVHCTIPGTVLSGNARTLTLSGWNIKEQTLTVEL